MCDGGRLVSVFMPRLTRTFVKGEGTVRLFSGQSLVFAVNPNLVVSCLMEIGSESGACSTTRSFALVSAFVSLP